MRVYKNAKTELTAAPLASRLATNDKVSHRINALLEKRTERNEVTADMVIQELRRLAFSDLTDFCDVTPNGMSLKDWAKLTPDQRKAIESVSESVTNAGGNTSFKLHSKTKALELLGRHLGMFNDKMKIDASVSTHKSIVNELEEE